MSLNTHTHHETDLLQAWHPYPCQAGQEKAYKASHLQTKTIGNQEKLEMAEVTLYGLSRLYLGIYI